MKNLSPACVVLLLACGLAVSAAAEAHMEDYGAWPEDVPLPQDSLLQVSLPALEKVREDLSEAMVIVQMGAGEENPRWIMSQTNMQVLLDRLHTMPENPVVEDDIWPHLKSPSDSYKGMVVLFKTLYGKRFAPIRVYQGSITGPDGRQITPDYGRYLEYWLFGTARVRRDQLLGVNVLPVISFEQCRLLGQKIVETTPRQCLLPDNNLLLETSEKPTLKAAQIRNFNQCLQDGKALIYTFPRRCVAAGGRVFTEPPQVYEASRPLPADAPLAVGGGSPLGISESVVGLLNDMAKLKSAVDGITPTLLPEPAAAILSPSVPAPALPAVQMPPPVHFKGVSPTAQGAVDPAAIEPAAGPVKPAPWYMRMWPSFGR